MPGAPALRGSSRDVLEIRNLKRAFGAVVVADDITDLRSRTAHSERTCVHGRRRDGGVAG